MLPAMQHQHQVLYQQGPDLLLVLLLLVADTNANLSPQLQAALALHQQKQADK
jgi:hypothetical protein